MGFLRYDYATLKAWLDEEGIALDSDRMLSLPDNPKVKARYSGIYGDPEILLLTPSVTGRLILFLALLPDGSGRIHSGRLVDLPENLFDLINLYGPRGWHLHWEPGADEGDRAMRLTTRSSLGEWEWQFQTDFRFDANGEPIVEYEHCRARPVTVRMPRPWEAPRVLGWHFLEKPYLAHDGHPRTEVTTGTTLQVHPPVILCDRGLHACFTPYDAFDYVEGDFVCRVASWGHMVVDTDRRSYDERHPKKYASEFRRVLWIADCRSVVADWRKNVFMDQAVEALGQAVGFIAQHAEAKRRFDAAILALTPEGYVDPV